MDQKHKFQKLDHLEKSAFGSSVFRSFSKMVARIDHASADTNKAMGAKKQFELNSTESFEVEKRQPGRL